MKYQDLPETMLDKPDQWTKQIHASHPLRTGAHKQYEMALDMVSNRHSKGELVNLVCWLLQRIDGVTPCQTEQDCESPDLCKETGGCERMEPVQDRAAFEAAMEGEELDFTLYTLPGCENSYSNMRTQLAYFAWRQGRASKGCIGMMDALQRILDGKDDGSGVSNEPWESLRRRVLGLMRKGATVREALLLVLDQVDYTKGACSPTEMVGACLPTEVIDKARAALAATKE